MSGTRPTIVFLTGAGMSADSGLKTFRDSDGLWEGHRVEDVATFEAWRRDPAFVLEFYNERRRALLTASPNPGHFALAQLEEHFNVEVVTQNVDDLHERAGSQRVLHLHGELRKSRSTLDESVFEIEGTELRLGDLCPNGSQLRPHIVWFGEPVPLIEEAARIVRQADIFVVVGTSLAVYPAAGLIDEVPKSARCFVVDPSAATLPTGSGFEAIAERAAIGCQTLASQLQSALRMS